MLKEAKDTWLEALRSGEYEQGTHHLRDEYSTDGTQYCCLGVLLACTDHEVYSSDFEHHCMNDEDQLSAYALDYFQLEEDDQQRLIRMNDGPSGADNYGRKFALEERAYTFEEIADYIEKNL